MSTNNMLLGHEDVHTARMAPLDHANPMCNGPKCRWLGTELRFEFTGYVNDWRRPAKLRSADADDGGLLAGSPPVALRLRVSANGLARLAL